MAKPKGWIPQAYKPSDWLKGGSRIGQKYTAYSNYYQGKPDFGKGSGPGEPYREVSKTVNKVSDIAHKAKTAAAKPLLPQKWEPKGDPRSEAIRRRLRGL